MIDLDVLYGAGDEIIAAFDALPPEARQMAVDECYSSSSPFLADLGRWLGLTPGNRLVRLGVFRAIHSAVLSGDAEAIAATADTDVDEPGSTILRALEMVKGGTTHDTDDR